MRPQPFGGIPAILALLSFAAMQSACTREQVEANVASREVASLVVPAARLSRADIANHTTLTAEFQPFEEVDVMAKVAGYVRSMKVDLGDRVQLGQILAELEIPEMNDELSKAAASVEQNGAEIAAARDELQRSESSHQIAHLSFSRLKEASVREPGLIPQQELDEVHSRDLVAEAQVASAKSRLRVAESRTTVAKAEESRLRTMRNYVTITAPFPGTVTRRYANVGSLIQAGTASQTQAMPLVRLSQVAVLRLSLPVPESLVSLVRVGQPVEVRVRSLGRTFPGKIARFAGRVDLSTRTMITEVDVANRESLIVPGMYAEVAFQTAVHRSVLAAPLEAVERTSSGGRVYAVDPGGTVRVATVSLGFEDSGRVEILSGLQQSDLVITGKRAGLNHGDRVQPKIIDLGR